MDPVWTAIYMLLSLGRRRKVARGGIGMGDAKARAGLSEAPVIGPITVIIAITAPSITLASSLEPRL
jgi:hypothetical protein